MFAPTSPFAIELASESAIEESDQLMAKGEQDVMGTRWVLDSSISSRNMGAWINGLLGVGNRSNILS